jgi:hypothetical protein
MRAKAVLVLAAAILFALSPALAPRFEGFDPAQMPVAFAFPPVQPAGYAFALWGPIFLWLALHAGFGLLRRAEDPVWDRARWPLLVAMAVGVPWLAIASASPVLGTVTIWIMLGGALWAFRAVPQDRDRWLLSAPLALFAGWLTAASWVALATLAAGYGAGTAGLWSFLGLLGALAVAVPVQMSRPEPVYGAALIWALIGVAVAAFSGGRTAQGIAALAGAAAMLALAARAMRTAKRPHIA